MDLDIFLHVCIFVDPGAPVYSITVFRTKKSRIPSFASLARRNARWTSPSLAQAERLAVSLPSRAAFQAGMIPSTSKLERPRKTVML